MFRASHVFYFDADDGLADLARSLPKLKLVGADRRGVRFGDFHRLVLPLMQLAEGDDVGFPNRKYGKDTLDDVLALDPAWKMAVHLMRADEWGACAIGTLVDRLKTAKGRATPAQLCMFTVTREDQFYEVPQDADPAQRMLLWMGEAGYTPEELFMDGGCDIAAIVDYYTLVVPQYKSDVQKSALKNLFFEAKIVVTKPGRSRRLGSNRAKWGPAGAF